MLIEAIFPINRLEDFQGYVDTITFTFPVDGPNYCGCKYFEASSGYDQRYTTLCVCGADSPQGTVSVTVSLTEIILVGATLAPRIFDLIYKHGLIYTAGYISFWLNDVENPFDIAGSVEPQFCLKDSNLSRLLSVKPDTGIKRIFKMMNRTSGFGVDCVPYGKAFNTHVLADEGLIIVTYAMDSVYRGKRIVHECDPEREKNGIFFWVRLSEVGRRGLLVGRLRAAYLIVSLMRLQWKGDHFYVEFRTTAENRSLYWTFWCTMQEMVRRPGLCRHVSVDEREILGYPTDCKYGKRGFLQIAPEEARDRWSEQ